MSKVKVGANNPMFGKSHTEQTKDLMSKARLGKILGSKTKEAISISNGTPIYLYAENTSVAGLFSEEKLACPDKLAHPLAFGAFLLKQGPGPLL